MIETGVYFNDVHSFYSLNLILSKVEVSPATPKTVYVDIPGADGSLDLSEALGEVKFSDRTLKFTFTMHPGEDLSESAWEAKKTQVSNRLNGLACQITLEKDLDYYWQGRTTVDEYQSNKRLRQIVVTAVVRPYKYKRGATEIEVVLSSTKKTITLPNSRKSVCPIIRCTNDNTEVVFDGATYVFSRGEHKNLGVRLVEGPNNVTVSGTGKVTFIYQEADL